MNRISIKDASREMGVSEQFLRVMIREGRFPWAVASQIGGPSGRWTYYINERAYRRYMDGEL